MFLFFLFLSLFVESIHFLRIYIKKKKKKKMIIIYSFSIVKKLENQEKLLNGPKLNTSPWSKLTYWPANNVVIKGGKSTINVI